MKVRLHASITLDDRLPCRSCQALRPRGGFKKKFPLFAAPPALAVRPFAGVGRAANGIGVDVVFRGAPLPDPCLSLSIFAPSFARTLSVPERRDRGSSEDHIFQSQLRRLDLRPASRGALTEPYRLGSLFSQHLRPWLSDPLSGLGGLQTV